MGVIKVYFLYQTEADSIDKGGTESYDNNLYEFLFFIVGSAMRFLCFGFVCGFVFSMKKSDDEQR